ncbi:phage-type endonuclease [Hyphomicrobium denitrificans ATCC 51888]|uniref:Phage-type endonuclease n=1 Tax=Hyphomicrobium denitrificans (strain ATCC 51888 / DSM 1869 / NCIMB 11706 / TK 0415) TaxID=582899 RepID=D8JQ30_HYPDA|nr:lambda exonuclease family protein [Hyphomicrobium denitrificans]ADJ21951.1 phage-type endonuclease [Hyphomicrobium denitrificans ATCC 51888]
MNVIDCEQNSAEWLAARCGNLGASSIADMVAKTRTGWGASRFNLAARIVCERLTGTPQESYTNAAMQWGHDTEPQARAMYEFMRDVAVQQVGLVLHPSINKSHASPDGLVGDAGLIEIKCPNTATHIETLLSEDVEGKYIKQMQWQMACCGRAWCDFVSFDPRLPAEMQMFVQRVPRDDDFIAELEREARLFLAEIDKTIATLSDKYLSREAAE